MPVFTVPTKECAGHSGLKSKSANVSWGMQHAVSRRLKSAVHCSTHGLASEQALRGSGAARRLPTATVLVEGSFPVLVGLANAKRKETC